MSTRSSARRGSFARKQKKYTIESDSEEDDSEHFETSKATGRKPKFGGVLATLKNDENICKRTTRSNSRKQPIMTSPPMKQQSKSDANDENGRTPPPGSIVMTRSAMRAISPLTVHKPKSRGKQKIVAKNDSYSQESSRSDSFVSDEDDDDDETRPLSMEEDKSKSRSSEHSEDNYEDSFEDSESSSECEFNGDDEEFVPDDDDEYDEDESSAALSEFIVDDVSEERHYANYANNSPDNKRKIVESVDEDDDEDDIFKQSVDSLAKSETSNKEDMEEDFEEDDCVGTECASFAFDDAHTNHTEINEDNHTEIVEETPSKPDLPRKTLDFESPEPQLAMVVDADEDSDDDGDVLFATIVNSESGDGDTVVLAFDEEEEINDEKSEATSIQESMQKTPASKSNSDEVAETNSKEKAPENISASFSSPPQQQNQNEKSSKVERKIVEIYSPKPPLSAKKKSKRGSKTKYRQEGEVKRGKWALGEKIGTGSFGTVHCGMNKKTGTLMAVKKFKMQGAVMEDIRTEVELMRSLKHINIVRYLGAQMDEEYLHIFQEWVPGGSVDALLRKYGAFSIEVIQSYMSQTLEGLNYLHDNDIMHRDIKGSNILVNDEGIVKLADFGASKKLKNLASNMMMSLTVRGTPYFMAPEVFEEKYSAKADIWGIGCVAFQMVTSLAPWKELGFTNPISLFNHIKKNPGSPPMEHPEREYFSTSEESSWILLQEFVNKCFQEDPSNRPSVKELLEDPFILTTSEHDDDESTHYCGLFSPKAESKTLFSPKQLSLSAKTKPKLNERRKTTKLSPPRLKSNIKKDTSKLEKTKTTPAKESSRNSPSPDTRGWPAWAKSQLEKQKEKASSESKEIENVSTLLDSLAFSSDSSDAAGRQSNASSNYSSLLGLNHLDSTGSDTTTPYFKGSF